MKKLLIISLAVLGLGVVSCQKEDLTQNSISGPELPVWDEGARVGSGVDDGDGDVGGITDPNDDNDEPVSDDEENGRTLKRGGDNSETSGS